MTIDQAIQKAKDLIAESGEVARTFRETTTPEEPESPSEEPDLSELEPVSEEPQ